MAYEHGGDVYSRAIDLDFSVNISPLGIPAAVREAVADSIPDLIRYPDEELRSVRRMAAVFFQNQGFPVSEEEFLMGSGAAELFYDIFRALRPDHVILPEPSFSEYQKSAEAVGASVTALSMAEGNRFSHRIFLENLENYPVPPGRNVLVIGHPSNPTGLAMTEEEIREIVFFAHEKNLFVLVDECFLWFVPKPKRKSFLTFAGDPHMICVNAITKAAAVPGLRAGFACIPDADLREEIRKVRQPWSLSIPAERAMEACFRMADPADRLAEFCAGERNFLTEGLRALGFTVFPSDVNFLLFRKEAGDPADYREKLIRERILVRSCANFNGLDARYYRIGVKSREENRRLLDALAKIRKEGITWQNRS